MTKSCHGFLSSTPEIRVLAVWTKTEEGVGIKCGSSYVNLGAIYLADGACYFALYL